VWHAASSGGTTAGLGWGADRLDLALPLVACSVDLDARQLTATVESIWRDGVAAHGGRLPQPPLTVIDDYVGGGYGVSSADELATQAVATSLTGMLFDPTYTGKAIHGLRQEIAAGRWSRDDHVVFWHTGGGFALFAHDAAELLPEP
jgi:1-aminocyclopropane-1-carboxylate deaminase/D-cysteine desulfhydrase-like pyridoxal-dependent ACC family enzyme